MVSGRATDAQRDLRDLKRDVADRERDTRQQFQDERLRISNAGQTIGIFAGGKARGAMARGRAIEKRRLADQQAHTLRPFADVKSLIDRAVGDFDRQKAMITEDIARQRAERTAAKTYPSQAPQPAAVPISSALPAPQWGTDPTARHQYRYWDGHQWTEHVSDNGDTRVDPLN